LHVLHALSETMPAHEFGRVSQLPRAQLAAVVDGMRARGLVGDDGWLTAAGRKTQESVELLTDELAAPAYDVVGRGVAASVHVPLAEAAEVEPGELDLLVDDLEPLAAVLVAAGSQ